MSTCTTKQIYEVSMYIVKKREIEGMPGFEFRPSDCVAKRNREKKCKYDTHKGRRETKGMPGFELGPSEA